MRKSCYIWTTDSLIPAVFLVQQPSCISELGPPGRSSLDSMEMAYARQVSMLKGDNKSLPMRLSHDRHGRTPEWVKRGTSGQGWPHLAGMKMQSRKDKKLSLAFSQKCALYLLHNLHLKVMLMPCVITEITHGYIVNGNFFILCYVRLFKLMLKCKSIQTNTLHSRSFSDFRGTLGDWGGGSGERDSNIHYGSCQVISSFNWVTYEELQNTRAELDGCIGTDLKNFRRRY